MVKNLEWVDIGQVKEIKNLCENDKFNIEEDRFKILNNTGLYCIYKKDIYPQIIYLGKSNRKRGKALYKRIKEYMLYDKNREKSNHKGGKTLWEIDGYDDFYIKVCKCDCCEIMESELLSFYKYLHGDYPPANKQD